MVIKVRTVGIGWPRSKYSCRWAIHASKWRVWSSRNYRHTSLCQLLTQDSQTGIPGHNPRAQIKCVRFLHMHHEFHRPEAWFEPFLWLILTNSFRQTGTEILKSIRLTTLLRSMFSLTGQSGWLSKRCCWRIGNWLLVNTCPDRCLKHNITYVISSQTTRIAWE